MLKQSIRSLFNEDQLNALGKTVRRGSTWCDETIQKALKLRLACGTNGYNLLLDSGYPLPSERTHRRRLENINFCPGVLKEIFPSLGRKVQLMSPLERHAVLMLDEMSIKPALEFDASVGRIIGNSTLKDSQNKEYSLTTHALVFMLGGMSTHWKQTVGYHFTGPSFCARVVKEVMFDLIMKCEELGLSIDTVVSDMGGQNQALWKECGIIGGKYTKTTNYCEHPCDVNRKLFFIPDTPHIMKSLRNHLTGHQAITIPSCIVDELGFICNEVKVDYVEQLFEIDSGYMDELGDDENNSLFYLAGRTVRQILPQISGCYTCEGAIEGGDELSDVSLLTELKDYTGSSLIKPAKSVFDMIKIAERCLRDQRQSILKGEISHATIISFVSEGASGCDLPTCHNVIGKLITNYTRTRFHLSESIIPM
ncbi:hypothetical protein J437_LFUL011952 [Ladona fulva]|uniref:Transposable element P transposase-like RNase H domain-containing protein n=1 Tax=Ladona fulva TaxID=123851 RepID=A0A8K0P382_LADFU|nr:hypothetical protein J437_LFUL011952 [Ladona fulva]